MAEAKKTVVLGATTRPSRYAYVAATRLQQHQIPIALVGIREGEINGIPIQIGQPFIEDVHTITLYINPKRQETYYDYLLNLQPKRIIFNPGTENPILINLAKAKGIQTEIGCTLVMLSLGSY